METSPTSIMPRYQLTPAVETLIVASIRGGGYAHMAAETAGIPRDEFDLWMKRGARSARPPYRHFWEHVMQAKAQARLGAEMEVRRDDPNFWLRHGPGKEPSEAPGWADARHARKRRKRSTRDSLTRLLPALLDALTPFPEARATAAQAMEALQPVSAPAQRARGLKRP